MSIISKILMTLSALLFFYIMYLETVATTSQATSRVFSISREQLAEPKFNTLMKNQGVYNGFIGAALLYAAYFASAPKELALVLLINILVVAAYGAVTSDKAILVKQGGLPFLALLSLLF